MRPGGSRGSKQGSLGGVEPGAEEGEVGQGEVGQGKVGKGKVGKGKVGGQEVVTEKEQEQGKEHEQEQEQERGKGEMSKYLYPGPVSRRQESQDGTWRTDQSLVYLTPDA